MKTNWICAAITLFIIGCSAIPFEVVRKDDGYEMYALDGTILGPCVAVANGCRFQLGIGGDANEATVFVPWGNKLYKQVMAAEDYAHVHVTVVARGDDTYVLRSMKEIR